MRDLETVRKTDSFWTGVKDITSYSSEGQNAMKIKLEGLEGLIKNEIRATNGLKVDTLISVYDVIEVVGGKINPRKSWERLVAKNPEVVAKCYNLHKFKGRGQRETLVASLENIFYLIDLFPDSPLADTYRADAAKLMAKMVQQPEEVAKDAIGRVDDIKKLPGVSLAEVRRYRELLIRHKGQLDFLTLSPAERAAARPFIVMSVRKQYLDCYSTEIYEAQRQQEIRQRELAAAKQQRRKPINGRGWTKGKAEKFLKARAEALEKEFQQVLEAMGFEPEPFMPDGYEAALEEARVFDEASQEFLAA